MSTRLSQQRAAHNRYHRDKNIVKSSCAICQEEHPELVGEVELNNEPMVEIIKDSTNDPIKGARIFIHPVLQAPDPDKEFNEQLERDTLWKYAALRRSIEEVAKVMNCSPKEMAEKVIRNFKTDWDSLSERAFLEMQYEVECNIYLRAKGNDARFVLLYQKLLGIPGYTCDSRVRSLPMPASVQHDLSAMSTEELMRRRQDLCRVIDRKPSFAVGPISATLEVHEVGYAPIPTEPAKLVPAPMPVPKIIEIARPVEQTLESEPIPEPPAQVVESTVRVQGPCVYIPDAAEPLRM